MQILEFVCRKEIVSPVERFGYTSDGARSMPNWLKREHLIINDRHGEWTVTDTGIRRLRYHGRL